MPSSISRVSSPSTVKIFRPLKSLTPLGVILRFAEYYSAKNNDKVLCEITSFPQRGLPHGKIIEILGQNGDFDAEELSIQAYP